MRAALAVILLVLSGCLADDDPDDPAPPPGLDLDDLTPVPNASNEFDGRNLTHLWDGELGAGAEVPLVNSALLDQYASADHSVLVDESVATLTLSLQGIGVSVARLRDAEGNLMCVARVTRTCATLVRANATETWPIEVISLDPDGAAYDLAATLRPDAPTLANDGLARGAVDVHRSHDEGGEPTLAVLADGRVLVVAGTGVLRLEADGTYTDVTPPVEAAASQTLDPFLYGDDATGRVYVTQLAQCMRMSWTDDGGESWMTHPAVCGGPEQHHQKLAVGPGPTPLARAVHVATMNLASWLTTDELVIFHSRSLDGGVTWTQNPSKVQAFGGAPEGRAIGNIATPEQAGIVHAVAYLCDRFVDADYGGLGVGRSGDYGATWTWQAIAPGGGRCEGIDPGIWAVGGEVQAAWEDMAAGPGQVWWARSLDGGVGWGDPEVVPTAGLGSFAFTDLAMSADRVAVAFLATPDTTVGPTQAPGWARWFPYLATRDLADGGAWDVVRLQDDPVQLGPICMDGPKCLDGARNLLDFIDVRLGPGGKAYAAYPDGCEAECDWPYESRDAFLRVAVER